MSSSKRVFSIPWQDSGSHRKAKYLLDTGLMADCSFLVGDETNAKRFDCHKIILISASPVFETMFCSSFKEANSANPIPIPDSQPEVFRLFLEFLYDPCQSSARICNDESCSEYSEEEDYIYEYSDTSETRDDVLSEKFQNYNFDTLKNLLYLGNKYMIKSLGRQCCLALNQQLRVGNEECILRIFALAVTNEHKGLAKKSAKHFERQFSLAKTEVIFDLDASVLCEFLKYLELTSSRQVLDTIDTYIKRNRLNVEANDVNEFEYGICKSCENPYKRQKKDRLKNPDLGNDRHLGKKTLNCDTGKSHASHKKQKLDKTYDVEPSTSKGGGASSSQCHDSSNTSTSGNNSTSTCNQIDSTDGTRNLKIIKQLYESVNFVDLEPMEFLKVAKRPGLSEYLSYRRKYEILEKLCKNFQRSLKVQHIWK